MISIQPFVPSRKPICGLCSPWTPRDGHASCQIYSCGAGSLRICFCDHLRQNHQQHYWQSCWGLYRNQCNLGFRVPANVVSRQRGRCHGLYKSIFTISSGRRDSGASENEAFRSTSASISKPLACDRGTIVLRLSERTLTRPGGSLRRVGSSTSSGAQTINFVSHTIFRIIAAED